MKTTEQTPETPTMEVMKEPALNEFQKNALIAAEKELEDLRKELNSKKYLIDVNKDEIAMLITFNEKDAPWKFTECLGVVEIEKSLKTAKKEGKLYVGAIAVEAIYYYLSKVTGKGKTTDTEAFANVDDYIKILKAITGGIEKIKADTERLNNKEFVVASRREGIAPDTSAETDGK